MLYIYENDSEQYIKVSGRKGIRIQVSDIYPELKEAVHDFFDSFWEVTSSPEGYKTICILSTKKISELENSAINTKVVDFDEYYPPDESLLRNEWFKSYEEEPEDWPCTYTFYPYKYWTYSERLQFKLGKRRKKIM